VKIARGQTDLRRAVDLHDVHFSFGERIGAFEPATGHAWQPVRQPVLLDDWQTTSAPSRNAFTTIMNWTSYHPVEFGEQTYGQKDAEFRKFIELPSAVAPVPLELAINAGRTRRTPHELLAHRGWRIVSPADVCGDLDAYRSYIQTSRGEWSVAKQGYVAGRSGWFSCRSACYLAAGRPVVVQDTAFGAAIPTGVGVVAFATPDQAAAAVKEVDENYDRHARASREIAEAYFDSALVLTRLVDEAMARAPVAVEAAP
jgi:hypothetical protein